MIRWLIGVSLRARVAVLMLALLVIGVGIVQLRSSTIDAFPEFDPPMVEVQTEALGLSAAEVESLITVPLEADLLNGVAWLDDMRSQSVAGLSSIVLEFEPGTDPIRARQMVQERLTQAHALPNVSKPPVMLQPLSSNSRVMMVGLSSAELTPIELGVLARWNIKPRLLGVPGVANVAVWGHRDRQLQVLVDPAELHAAGVTLSEVVETAGEALWVSPLTYLESSKPGTGGWIDTPNQRLGIRHLLPIATPEDLGKVPVVDHPDLVIADIASVAEGNQQLIGDALVDGEPGLLLVIERYPGADPIEVTEGVETTLDTMRAGLPGVDIDTDVFRPASYMSSMAGNLTLALAIGLALALLALALFVWSWRTALVGFVVILASLGAALVVLDARDESLNILTIGGLLIALGVVVDAVVTDTLASRRRLREAADVGSEGSNRAVVFFSAVETSRAAFTAAIVLLLVILPVFFLGGLRGSFFSPLATSYMIAIAASFVVALLVTPGLTLLLHGDRSPAPGSSPLAGPLDSLHDRVTAAAGRLGSTVVLAVAGVMALAGVATVWLMDTDLSLTFEQDSAMIQWDAAPGTSPSVMLDTIEGVTQDLDAIDGVESVSAHIGRAETGDLAVSINTAEIWVRFDDDDRAATVDAIEAEVADLPGSVSVSQTFLPERLDEALSGSESDLTVRVYGVDLDELDAKAAEIAGVVDVVDGVSATSSQQRVLEPQLAVKVDLATAEQYGILPGTVRRQATTLISGLQVGSLFEEQKVFDVVVWAKPELRDDVEDFADLLVDLPDGSQVALSELASIETVQAPLNIRRDAVSRYLDVNVSVSGRSAAAVADDISAAIRDEVEFPQEYRAEVIDPSADEASGWGLWLLVGAVLLGIYLLIQAAFNGWRLALGLMVTAAVALFGAVVGGVIVDGAITLPVLFGLLAVLGLAVRHHVAVVDRARDLELDAAEPDIDLIHQAVRERTPAMITTAVMMALFLVPSLLMGNRPGLELLRPMAVVVLFGLVTVLLSTMVVVPAVYHRFRPARHPEDPIDARLAVETSIRHSPNGDADHGDESAAVGGADHATR